MDIKDNRKIYRSKVTITKNLKNKKVNDICIKIKNENSEIYIYKYIVER